MSEEDESKQFMKKLVTIISTMSESLQALEEKINLSNRQMALLTKRVEAIALKINKMDTEVEDEFAKLSKIPDQVKTIAGIESELGKMEKEVDSIPDEILDDELKKLLKEDKKTN